MQVKTVKHADVTDYWG